MKRIIIVCILFFIMIALLTGCTTTNNQPIIKQQMQLNVDSDLLIPSKPLITLEQYKKSNE